MYFGINKSEGHTAAWRISFWSTLAFAAGSVILFIFLQRFASQEIQRRTDAWLSGEVETLGDVAERTPKNALYDRIVDEVAELATKEVPLELQAGGDPNQSVFFIETGNDNRLKLWVGKGDSNSYLTAITHASITPGCRWISHSPAISIRFAWSCLATPAGDRILLGLSEAHEYHVLRRMRIRLFSICAGDRSAGIHGGFFRHQAHAGSRASYYQDREPHRPARSAQPSAGGQGQRTRSRNWRVP